ncbi:TetR/AcrR family transcriptional regulator [Nocardia iowensis]|uniref:TetR/AcrR family transcriptional regulator C-terminal domain-containing protein n=1 Tax=Nocardia iowensis TaxID=204891 RepID=A0ABX8RGR6_NOCIO|nr:TetR/AcrR family transcriptional regulator C-terminal domain-containing protein [Nocardia iowensis]QXN88784.1 TetR/AcrR family transcriptional regulator C-terminal domain-containing protein [Nocardia iowensis]
MARTTERRADALTRERIIEAAVELLDSAGENGLTFRALATRFETGHGAIQWHIANKAELLEAATTRAVARAIEDADLQGSPRDALHALASGVFDAVEAHPWIGVQLARPPWRDAMAEIFERVGRLVRALGAPESVQFTTTQALLHYMIGASGQNATNARFGAGGDRQQTLDTEADRWQRLDPDKYPFTRTMAARLRRHDDRVEYLAGIDLIIDGMTTTAHGGER